MRLRKHIKQIEIQSFRQSVKSKSKFKATQQDGSFSKSVTNWLLYQRCHKSNLIDTRLYERLYSWRIILVLCWERVMETWHIGLRVVFSQHALIIVSKVFRVLAMRDTPKPGGRVVPFSCEINHSDPGNETCVAVISWIYNHPEKCSA